MILDYLENHGDFKSKEVKEVFDLTSERPAHEWIKKLLYLKILVKGGKNNQNVLTPEYNREEALESLRTNKPLIPNYKITSH